MFTQRKRGRSFAAPDFRIRIASEVPKMTKRIIPPCRKCPYKLGKVTAPKNPCPSCKLNGYSAYEQMIKLAEGGGKDVKQRV